MTLFFQATSLCIDRNDPSIVFAGVGPSICIVKDQKILKSQNLFEHYSRILCIQQYSDCILAYAENYLLKLFFSYKTLEFNIQNKYELPDILKAVDFSEEDNEIKAILGHGQIVHIKKDDSIELQNPPNWKTVTAASIQDDRFFYGDSFGTLTYVNNFDFETHYGTLFGIAQKFDSNSEQILTAHEHKAAALWNITDGSLECIWECKDFPSRVWGCNFFKGEPIIYSEDACIHYRDQIYQLHRSKTITALVIHGDTIITAGQYGTIRFSNFLNTDLDPQIFDIQDKQLISASLDDGTCLVGTSDGRLLLLPNFDVIYSYSDESEVTTKKGWFLLTAYKKSALCFSRDKKLLYYNKNNFLLKNDDKEIEANFSVKKLTLTASTLALNDEVSAIVMVDNSIRLFSLPQLEEVAFFDISNIFPSPPTTISIVKNGLHSIVAVGSLASVLVAEFDENHSLVSHVLIDTNTNDSFISLHFSSSCSLFCGGKSNGVISLIEKVEENNWRLKTHWRVPWQLHSITQISSVDSSTIVSVLTKDSIIMWDILSQTYIGKFSFKGNKNRVSVCANDGSFTASYCDGQKIILFSNSPCLSTKFVGPPFHGLRILSSCHQNSLLVTGSCDRDIRLWRLDNDGFHFLDCVYGSTDGTHSLCFGRIGSKSVVLSGGAKRNLITWEIVNENRLFLLKEFALDQFGIETKVNFTVNCCSIVNVKSESFLYLGSSDGFLNVFKYDCEANSKHIDLIDRKELKGTPMSIDSCEGKIVVAESTGDLFLEFIEDDGDGAKGCEVKVSNCGILMVKVFPVYLDDGKKKVIAASSCDDGKIILTDFEDQTELLKFNGNHSGGIRSLSVNVMNNGEENTAVVSIASFSYDQRCVVHDISIPDFHIINIKKFDTSIFDGEGVEYMNNNVVVLGSGMEMFSI